MTDTKELIKFLDWVVKGVKMFTYPFVHKENLALFEEIKQILSEVGSRKPDNDSVEDAVVEKIVSICDKRTWVSEFKKAEIRKLLRFRMK